MLRARTYEKFGPFLLFRKLHSDALSELWRGARLPGGEPAAVRRFIGGDLDALRAAAESAGRIVPHLTGTTIVRKQQIGVNDAWPFIAFHYSGGRPLGHIVERAQRSKIPNPVPIDQALTIAEKVAQSLVTLHHLKLQGRRLSHGALLPDFIWVSEDGEIRVAGQQMSEGFVRSRSVREVSALIDPYLAPELIEGEKASPLSDMYSLGAILFLLLTGRQPPTPSSSTSVVTALDEARLQTSGEAIPPELRSLLDRTIAWEPGRRFLSPTEAHRCVSTLLQADQYTATTFNLAFYLTTLLKDDLQREEGERAREDEFIEKSPADSQPSANHPILSHPPDPARSGTRRKRFIVLGGIVLVILLVAAAYLKMWAGPSPSGHPDAGASTQPVPQGRALTALATSATDDRIGRRRDSALPEERVGTDRPVSEAPARRVQPGESNPGKVDRLKVGSARGVDKDFETELSAAALDERRLRERQSAEATNESQQNLPTPTPVTTRVGDLVSLSDLDRIPQVVVSSRPPYPGIAQRQHLQATIALSALISETGGVLDVRVVRPVARLSSLEAAAIQSVKMWQFSPAIKEGKAVRTWMNVSVSFTMK